MLGSIASWAHCSLVHWFIEQTQAKPLDRPKTETKAKCTQWSRKMWRQCDRVHCCSALDQKVTTIEAATILLFQVEWKFAFLWSQEVFHRKFMLFGGWHTAQGCQAAAQIAACQEQKHEKKGGLSKHIERSYMDFHELWRHFREVCVGGGAGCWLGSGLLGVRQMQLGSVYLWSSMMLSIKKVN